MHDPRLGRFFAVDPLTSSYPYNSPYAFSENTLIDHRELEGLEKRHFMEFMSVWNAWGNSKVKPKLDKAMKLGPMGMLHLGLDIAGLAPVIGIVADGVNGLIYLFEGEYGNSAISFAAMIPVVGTGATATKYGVKLAKNSKTVRYFASTKAAKFFIENAAKHGPEAAIQIDKIRKRAMKGFVMVGEKFSPKYYRGNLQRLTGKVGKGYDAHHTLPKSKEFKEFFDNAGLDVNDPKQLVWRDAKKHRGTPSSDHLKEWRSFMKRNPNADADAILKQRDKIENKIWGNTKGDTPEY